MLEKFVDYFWQKLPYGDNNNSKTEKYKMKMVKKRNKAPVPNRLEQIPFEESIGKDSLLTV